MNKTIPLPIASAPPFAQGGLYKEMECCATFLYWEEVIKED